MRTILLLSSVTKAVALWPNESTITSTLPSLKTSTLFTNLVIKEVFWTPVSNGRFLNISIEALILSYTLFIGCIAFSIIEKHPINGTWTPLWWYIPFISGTNFPFQVLFLMSIVGIVLSIIFLVRRRKRDKN